MMEILYGISPYASALLMMLAVLLTISSFFDAAECEGGEPRHVYVRPGAPEGGNGDRETPYPSISAMMRLHDAHWACVYLLPGVYDEDVDIGTGIFWVMPAVQHGVTISGHISIHTPQIKLYGLDITGGLTLATGASHCEVRQCRITGSGEADACITIAGEDITDCIIADNIIDCRHLSTDRPTGLLIDISKGNCENRIDHNQIAGCNYGIDISAAGSTGTSPVISANRLTANSTGIAVWAPRIRIADNVIEESSDAAIEITGVSAFVESNCIIRNESGIHIDAPGATVHNSLIADCPQSAIVVSTGIPEIFHNTLYAPAGKRSVLLSIDAAARAYVRYNIFSSPGTLIEAKGEFSAQWNLFTHATEFAREPCMIGDPQFSDAASDDFTLSAQSPAAGAIPGTSVERDFRGYGRLGHIRQSIGAFEAPVDRGDNTNIYVAPDGDTDAGFGTEASPYGDIQFAVEQALPGDVVILKPGVYRPGVIHISCAGSPDAPVTIRSEVPHAAAIRETAVIFEDAACVRLEGVHIADSVGDALTLAANVHDCQFIGNLITREEVGSGHAVAVRGPGCCDNLFERNTILLTHGGCGIYIASAGHNHRMTIRRNGISGCRRAVQMGAGPYPFASPGFHIVEENELHHNTHEGCYSATSDNLLRANDIHHNGAGGVTLRCGSRNVMLDNRIHHNLASGIRLHGTSHFVLNNMIYANAGDGIQTAAWSGECDECAPHNCLPPCEPAHEIWIAGNTIADNEGAPVRADVGSQLMILRNILVGADQQAPGVQIASDGAIRIALANLYHNCRRLLLREHEGGFAEREADPLFINTEDADFRPADESPAYRMPAAVDALAFVRAAFPGAYDPGAHIGAHLPPPDA